MRRRWLFLILAMLPLGALAALGARFDIPAWLTERLTYIRTAIAPEPHVARRDEAAADPARPSGPRQPAAAQNATSPRGPESLTYGAAPAGAPPSEVAALQRTLAAPAPATPPASAAPAPSIDIVRIDPQQGTTVIAGTGEPNARVTVLADGEPIAVVTADENGEWVLVTTYAFASADPEFAVRPGAMRVPRRALAEARAAAAPSGSASGGDMLRPTAAAVTRRMLHQLERLTDEASTSPPGAGSEVAASTASAPQAERAAGTGGQVAGRALTTASIAGTPVPAGGSFLAVPVQFRYRESAFTDAGRNAAELLLRYFKAKNFRKVVLSGHADERGSDASNMGLSEARLQHLAAFLREGGFEGQLELVPKGESEAYTGVDRAKYPIEELWQLDRRVEVVSVE